MTAQQDKQTPWKPRWGLFVIPPEIRLEVYSYICAPLVCEFGRLPEGKDTDDMPVLEGDSPKDILGPVSLRIKHNGFESSTKIIHPHDFAKEILAALRLSQTCSLVRKELEPLMYRDPEEIPIYASITFYGLLSREQSDYEEDLPPYVGARCTIKTKDLRRIRSLNREGDIPEGYLRVAWGQGWFRSRYFDEHPPRWIGFGKRT